MSGKLVFGKEVFDAEGTIESAVISIKKNPDAFIFLVNGSPVPVDMPIADGMSVEAIRVASGG